MEIVVNKCYGGFDLSHKAIMHYAKLKGIKLYAYQDKRDKNGRLIMSKEHTITFERWNEKGEEPFIIYYATIPNAKTDKELDDNYFSEREIPRTDKALIQTIKELGKEANTKLSNLKIIRIPDDIEYEITEYDGIETIHEKHRSW